MNEEENNKLGGENIRVQIDETIIIAGKIIRNTCSIYNKMTNAVWLVGAIEEDDSDRFVL